MRDVSASGVGYGAKRADGSAPPWTDWLSARTPEDDGGHSVPRLLGSTPSGRIGTMWSVDQLGLSPFVAGDLVQWWDARGRRTGRFIGVIVRGPHRGAAEVAVGGALVEERIIRVPAADEVVYGTRRPRRVWR